MLDKNKRQIVTLRSTTTNTQCHPRLRQTKLDGLDSSVASTHNSLLTSDPSHIYPRPLQTKHLRIENNIANTTMARPGGYPAYQKPASAPARDSLELASLASTDDVTAGRASFDSSASGVGSSRRLSLDDDEDPLVDGHGYDSGTGGLRPARQRTYSISSAFDFATNLFPLSSTAGLGNGYAPIGATAGAVGAGGHGAGAQGGVLERHKTLTFTNGLSLIIGLIIGSGIFSSPSQVNTNAGSIGASLIVWVVAGLLAWTGAASYAELGGAIPLNGGAQVYLAKIFGELTGFLFMWCAVFVLKPGSAAIIAIIFGEYVVRAFLGAEAFEINPWYNKGVAVAGLVVVTLLNCVSTKLGMRMGDMFMFLKFVALLGVAVIGIVVAATGFTFTGIANDEWKTTSWFAGTNTDISNLAVALYAGLWAYDGWDNVRHATLPHTYLLTLPPRPTTSSANSKTPNAISPA